MKVTILIPARMAATRFPGKPLARINGKPMIQWVYERSLHANADSVVVATDSQEIYEAVLSFGGRVEMTRDDHENGTGRIAEVAMKLDTDIVINVQGDEPTIHPAAIRAVMDPLKNDPQLEMATLAVKIDNPQDLFNPNVVKVVCNAKGRALYFSRAPIPYRKHAGMRSPQFTPMANDPHMRHIGIYGYRKDFLLRYVREPACPLENIEGLEQLRALYMGASIQVELTDHPSIGVDTPEDIAKAETYFQKEGMIP